MVSVKALDAAARWSSAAIAVCASAGSATQIVSWRGTGVAVGAGVAVGTGVGIAVAVGAELVAAITGGAGVAVSAGGGAAQAVQHSAATQSSAAARAMRKPNDSALQVGFEEPEIFVDRTGKLSHQISGRLIAQLCRPIDGLAGRLRVGGIAIGQRSHVRHAVG